MKYVIGYKVVPAMSDYKLLYAKGRVFTKTRAIKIVKAVTAGDPNLKARVFLENKLRWETCKQGGTRMTIDDYIARHGLGYCTSQLGWQGGTVHQVRAALLERLAANGIWENADSKELESFGTPQLQAKFPNTPLTKDEIGAWYPKRPRQHIKYGSFNDTLSRTYTQLDDKGIHYLSYKQLCAKWRKELANDLQDRV